MPIAKSATDGIDRQLAGFVNVVPADLAGVLGAPSLAQGSGTHFYIRPTDPLLTQDVREARDEANDLLRTLVGFADTMTPSSPPQVMRTYFHDHYADDASDELIGESEFFSPADFADADHRVTGSFDEFGQFTGIVDIYGEGQDYTVAYTESRGRPTACGPFRIELAVMMGLPTESLLELDRYQQIAGKLQRFGGLYVYRDGIRILPYGNADADFLQIERRRNISASDYFFSYRRMFGAVSLTRRHNRGLVEKAGREGFAANTAYRQFREILMAFLYRTALDFFRETSTRGDAYRSQRRELDRLETARRVRDRQTSQRRRAYREGLDRFFAQLAEDPPDRTAALIAERLEHEVHDALDSAQPDPGAVLAAEQRAREALRDIDRGLTVARPRGVGLPGNLRRLADAYTARRQELEENVLQPSLALIEQIAQEAEQRHGDRIARRLRFDHAVETAAREGTEAARAERRTLRTTSAEADRRARDLARERVGAVEQTVADVLAHAQRLDVDVLSDDEFLARRADLEQQIIDVAAQTSRALSSVTDQLAGVVWPDRDGESLVTQQDTFEALETELEELRERTQRDLQLTQLGVAIEVVNHEFRGVVRSIRRDLKRLKTWADTNEQLREPYQNLRANFEHLDAYLTLFTPLDRRLYRSKVTISGRDIERFVRNLFSDRLERHHIELQATDRFLATEVTVFPSSLYPVFVNLVDNALYWLTDLPGSDRRVMLDAEADGTLIVSDTGPGVAARDREAIFDVGFTRKPGGSGYGLHVARRALAEDGWQLQLAAPTPSLGADFRITPALDDPETT